LLAGREPAPALVWRERRGIPGLRTQRLCRVRRRPIASCERI